MLVKKVARTLALVLIIETDGHRTVWVESAAVASGLTVLEGAVVNHVVGEDHSADALGLSEFVDGSDVGVLSSFDGLDLVFLNEELLADHILHSVKLVLKALINVEGPHPEGNLLRLVDILLKSSEELLQWLLFQVLALCHHVGDLHGVVFEPEVESGRAFVGEELGLLVQRELDLVNEMLSKLLDNKEGHSDDVVSLLLFDVEAVLVRFLQGLTDLIHHHASTSGTQGTGLIRARVHLSHS